MSGPKDIVYKSSQQMSRGDLATFLRDIADRVESGTVVLKGDQKETPVKIPEAVELEVEYEIKKKDGGEKKQLELEISWGPGTGGVNIG
ncbi:MAG: amphi-Trp domain-containing protein [Spirochaeta sp.]|jgi:amphi-Trp domain-containing protein|nr:amphi-Trp domain-containing protein [Spirochaeta sp.]